MLVSKCTRLRRAAVLLCLLITSISSVRAEWEWARTNLNTDNQSIAYSVATDASGNVIAVGIFQKSLVVGKDTLAATFGGMFVIKYDASGNILWAKAAEGGASDVVPPSVKTDAIGNIVISGSFQANLAFDSATAVHSTGIDHDFFVVKYDPSGNALWARSHGGDLNDFASAVTTDKAGDVFVTGYYNSTSIAFGSVILPNVHPGSATTLTGNCDIFLAKYDASGNFQWARNIGNKGDEKSCGVVADSSGNVYFSGTFVEGDSAFVLGDTVITPLMWSGVSGYSVLYKYDASGNRIWTKYAENGSPTHLAIGKDGDVYMGGNLPDAVMFFGGRFDPDGIKLENIAYEVHYVCPPGVCLYPIDVFVAKYSPNGKLQWARNAGGVSTDLLTAMTLDPADNVYIAATFRYDSIYFDANVITKGERTGNIFWARYKSAGDLDGAYAGLNTKAVNSIAIANTGAIYFAGDYRYQMNLGPIELNGSWGYDNMFVAKCDERTLGVEQHVVTPTNAIGVYPNPNNGLMTVSLGAGGYSSIQVTDCAGRMLYSVALSGGEKLIDLQLPPSAPGIYVLKVTGNGQSGQVLFEKK